MEIILNHINQDDSNIFNHRGSIYDNLQLSNRVSDAYKVFNIIKVLPHCVDGCYHKHELGKYFIKG